MTGLLAKSFDDAYNHVKANESVRWGQRQSELSVCIYRTACIAPCSKMHQQL